jgi:hypothetical protein
VTDEVITIENTEILVFSDTVVEIIDTGTPIADLSGLADVATTGAYSDLTGAPTIGTAAAEDISYFATADIVTEVQTLQEAMLLMTGGGVNAIVKLTQAEYNSLTPDEATLYVIVG